jgi:sarcosine oxidase subunit gamma
MLDRASALAQAKPYVSNALTLVEARGFSLVQAAGFTKAFEKDLAGVVGKLPPRVGRANSAEGRAIFRIGPHAFWIVGPENDDVDKRLAPIALITPLSHSRTRIALEGAAVRQVLAKSLPLDFNPSAFGPGDFAMSGIHHTPVLVHCLGPDSFAVYAMRSFALSVWDWLADAALQFAAP